MITKNYNHVPMVGVTNEEYETLLVHLAEQVAAKIVRHGASFAEAHKTATDALANEFAESKTAREWLADAGKRLNVDTSDCVGV